MIYNPVLSPNSANRSTSFDVELPSLYQAIDKGSSSMKLKIFSSTRSESKLVHVPRHGANAMSLGYWTDYGPMQTCITCNTF